MAFGLVFAFAAAAAAADPAGSQREIRETREIATEVSKAVRRVQAQNLKLRRTLGDELQELTAEDITATTLRLGRLDADTARLHVTTLDNRIAQRQAALRLLEEDIARRAADLQGAAATALTSLATQAELQQLQKLRDVSVDLLDGFAIWRAPKRSAWRWPKSGSPCCARARSFAQFSNLEASIGTPGSSRSEPP